MRKALRREHRRTRNKVATYCVSILLQSTPASDKYRAIGWIYLRSRCPSTFVCFVNIKSTNYIDDTRTYFPVVAFLTYIYIYIYCVYIIVATVVITENILNNVWKSLMKSSLQQKRSQVSRLMLMCEKYAGSCGIMFINFLYNPAFQRMFMQTVINVRS